MRAQISETRSVERARRRIVKACLAAGIAVMASSHSSEAETLFEALASTYANHPAISAERARVRARDEEIARTQAGYRPTITGQADLGSQRTETDPGSRADGTVHPRTVSLSLSQPIFDGYQTAYGVKEAEASVLAQREVLRGVEIRTLLDAVTVYSNVIRDNAVVRLREANVRVLSEQLRATEERFAVGEVTRTDVAQARARRAGAISALEAAKSNVRTSIGEYVRVIGHAPTTLETPPEIGHLLPGTLDEAIAVGMAEDPDVVTAAFREQATRHGIKRIEGQALPSIRVDATIQERLDPSLLIERSETAQIFARLTVPFYQGGEVAASVRQAKEERLGQLDDIEDARIRARSNVVTAWSRLIAARAQLVSDQVQVEATQTALEGVREEEKVGQRTLLDVLDAEQEFLNAKVGLVSTQRDLIVAAYSLYASMGRLTASDLGVQVALYDTEEHFRETNGKWWGFTIEREEGYSGYTIDGLHTEQVNGEPYSGWQSDLSFGDWSDSATSEK
jgi:outer membrane protein